LNKIHLIFQIIYKKHAPWTDNFQFLAKSLILLNPKLNCKIEKISQDKNGRFVIAKLTIDDSHLVLVNIYSPNDVNQQVHFFKELQDQLQEYPHENLIIGGDFTVKPIKP